MTFNDKIMENGVASIRTPKQKAQQECTCLTTHEEAASTLPSSFSNLKGRRNPEQTGPGNSASVSVI